MRPHESPRRGGGDDEVGDRKGARGGERDGANAAAAAPATPRPPYEEDEEEGGSSPAAACQHEGAEAEPREVGSATAAAAAAAEKKEEGGDDDDEPAEATGGSRRNNPAAAAAALRARDKDGSTGDEDPRRRAGSEGGGEAPAPRRRRRDGGSAILHEALLRERHEAGSSFDDLYQVLEEIGRGGLCTVYRIRKRPGRACGGGGSSRHNTAPSPSPRRRRHRTASTTFLPNAAGAAAAAAPPHPAHGPAPPPPPPPPSAPFSRASSRGRSGGGGRSGSTAGDAGGGGVGAGLRDAVRRELLGRAASQRGDLSSSSSAPGTPGQEARRRANNVRSMSSPSSLALDSPFWLRGGGGGDETRQQPHRRLDVKALRAAFKRSHAPSSRESVGSPEMLYAVKVFNLKLLTPSQARQLKNEVEALKTLDHPSIIKAYETFTCKEAKQLMLVMELCAGGDLYARIPYQEEDVSRVLYHLLSALIYMHDRNIVHRDLKLENIMFESTHPDAAIKLIDFGLAARFGSSSSSAAASLGTSSVLKERVGTLYCMAPCVLLGKGYTCQAGMWSVGVIVYTMLSGGNQPFHGKTPKQVVARILQADYSFKNDDNDEEGAWSNVSDGAKDFIRGLLRLEPGDRMTARQAIKHPWIQKQASMRRSLSADALFWQPAAVPEGVPIPDRPPPPGPAPSDPTAPLDAPVPASPGADTEWKHRVASEMVRYAEWSDFRKLALNVIAKRSTSDEIFEIRKVFAEFDAANSGTITLDDFRAALTRYDPTYSDEELEDIFRKIDVGGTSVINYTEFLASALEARGSIEEWKLADAFDMLDHDGSGCISKDDLRRVVGDGADDAYLDELIAQAGGSARDGRISYPEFLRVFSEQTHDLVYGMYEASRGSTRQPSASSSSSSRHQYGSDASAGTDMILERRGLSVPRLVSVTARQKLLGRRKWLAASAKARLADALQVLTPTTKDDVMTYVTTGRPNPR